MQFDVRAGVWGLVVLGITSLAAALPPVGSQGSLSVSLGGKVERTELSRETAGFVALTIPLDRFAGRQRVAIAEDPDPDADKAPQVQNPKNQPNLGSETPGFSARNQGVRKLRRPAWSAALAKNTLRMALVTAGLPRDTQRLESIATRARTSAVLPEVAVRGMHSTDESLRLSPALDDSYRYTQTGGAGITLEARLTWKLDRLVFADEELGVERIRAERSRTEANLLERVAHLFAVWEKARVLAATGELGPEEQQSLDVKALEAEIELDLLTNGWFSQQIATLSDATERAQPQPEPEPARRSRVRPEPTKSPKSEENHETEVVSAVSASVNSELARVPDKE